MFDVIIIGCGPSGMTCAIYALRAGKSVLMLEKYMPGGQMALTSNIQNYPGLVDADGANLAINMFNQATGLGMQTKFEEVVSCDFSSTVKKVKTTQGEYCAYAVYIATGATARPLDVENEKKFINKGVSYCATCDGALYKGKAVAVVGGGNTAFEDVLYLSNLASKIYLIHRRDEFRGDKLTLQKIQKLSNVEILTNNIVVGLNGKDKLNKIEIKNVQTNIVQTIDVDAVFVAVGRKPDIGFLSDSLKLDKSGYIITDNDMQTNISGVFAGGDIRNTNLRQIVSACADGAVAGAKISMYVNSINK